jgi:hypothetical protein
MKLFLNTLLVATAGIALAACETMAEIDDEPPYELEAPMCKPTTPCQTKEALQAKVEMLASELAACQEASSRVRDAMGEELKK